MITENPLHRKYHVVLKRVTKGACPPGFRIHRQNRFLNFNKVLFHVMIEEIKWGELVTYCFTETSWRRQHLSQVLKNWGRKRKFSIAHRWHGTTFK